MAKYQQTFCYLTYNLFPHSLPSFVDRTFTARHIENINVNSCNAINQSLDTVYGRTDLQQNNTFKQFWTAEMQEVFVFKEHYYRKWRRGRGLNCFKC